MRNPAFRQWQWDHRFDPHIAPINHFVDTLRKMQGVTPFLTFRLCTEVSRPVY